MRRALLATALAVAPAIVGGCGTTPESTSVVCTDFRAGADLSGATFGVTGELERPYVAFAQAAGDLAAVANDMLHVVGASCEALAVELGADGEDPRTSGKLEPDAVRAWCQIAAERFAMVRPQLTRAHFAVEVAPPQCEIDTHFQIACEQKCATSPTCAEPSPHDRCPATAREGICAGTCTGSCAGSEVAPATCAGTCDGMCFGTCGEGSAAKACDAGCACTSACTGACTASCSTTPGGHCDAICAGACSTPMLAESCTKPLAPPACPGDVDCQHSCAASGAARATCPAGSFRIIVDGAAQSDPQAARIVGAMERNLPAIFLAARGRAKVLADGASTLLDSAGHILNHADQLGPMGAACGLLIGATGSEAKKSLDAALAGSKIVADAVDIPGKGAAN